MTYSISANEAQAQFVDAMREAGIIPTDPTRIIGDGTIHRFHCEGDRKGSRNGWCVLHVDNFPAGAYGNHKGDVCGTWRAGRGCMGKEEVQRLVRDTEKAKRQRTATQWATWRRRRADAVSMWTKAVPAKPDHPYLAAKHIQPHGIRQSGPLLFVPMWDTDGDLWSVQTIAGNGTKRFLAGARKRGLYFTVGGPVTDELYICEGVATGVSVFEAAGKPVAVAFDCGNLMSVGRALRKKYPEARITFCADNDTGTAGNPGVAHASEAARAVGGYVALPPGGRNDFNDALVQSLVDDFGKRVVRHG